MTAQMYEPRDENRSSPLEAPELQRRVCAVIDRALEVRIADYEDVEREGVEPLRGLALEALHQSLDAIAVVQDHCERRGAARVSEIPPSGRGRGLCDTVDRHHGRPSGLDKVGDLAFVASLGLRSRLATVEAVAAVEDKWEVISECSGAFREVLKSLTAIEHALCEVEGLEARSSFYVSELERALLTRRAYVRLRQDVLGAGAPVDEEIPPRLRLAATAIAKLVSRDIYVSARVHDRRLIRQVQERIRAWMLEEPSAQSSPRVAWLLAGMRLYRDIANVCDLILAINYRESLCAHDAEVFGAALEKLHARGDEEVSLADDFPELESVGGRDPELDGLVLAGGRIEAPKAAAAVERALRHLRGG